MMAADCLEALGIKRGDYVVKVNNRKVLDGVMEAIGLGGAENAGRRLTVLRAIDKLDRLGPEGVRALLGAGRKDESGDFTKGAGLEAWQIAAVLAVRVRSALLEAMRATASRQTRLATAARTLHRSRGRRALGETANMAYAEGLNELAEIRSSCAARLRRRIASASTPPSSAASNITPARSSRPS